MNKSKVREILMSMRTPTNEKEVNFLLGKVDMVTEEKFQELVAPLGDDENNIRKFLEEKIQERKNSHHEHRQHIDDKKPINSMFTYGITGDCVHLHLPGSLKKLIEEKGLRTTIDIVNLHLIDAIEKIKNMSDKSSEFKAVKSVYMISPILVRRELDFLGELGFDTKHFSQKELEDSRFRKENPEAELAKRIFGSGRMVGTARIGLEKLKSKECQEARDKKMKKYKDQGLSLDEEVRE